MHTNSEWVNLALEKLREVKKEVKCSEDFVESHNYPTFSLGNIKDLSRRSDFFKILQIFMLNKASRECIDWLDNKIRSLPEPQLLSRDVASIRINGYGECGEISHYLMLKLMETNKFPMISRYEILTNDIHINHQFITVEDESGIEWALDPFFNIFCPLKDYWQNKKLISYFNKHLKISDWNKDRGPEPDGKEYSTRIQNMALPIYKEQIKTLCLVAKTQGHPSIEATKKAHRITSNNYEDGLVYMKECFVKDIMELDKLSKDGATSFVNRCFEKIPLNGSSNDNIQEIPSNNSNSNTDFFKDPNELIAIKLGKVFPRNETSNSFWTAIDSKGYSKALRMVSTMPSKEVSLQLAKILCEFKTQFSIEVDQKNSQGFSAIDYAKQKGNRLLRKLSLIQFHVINC